MKKLPTLILLVLVAALAAFISLFESKKPGTRETAEQAGRLVELDPGKIRNLTITDGETVVTFERKDDQWRVTRPVEDRADPSVARQILSAVEFLRREQTIEAGDDKDAARKRLSEFGLTTPKVRLDFGGDQAPPPILFGKETAVEGRIYARLGDGLDVYVVPDSILETVRKKPNEFRDRRLSDLDPSRVGRLVIRSGAGEIEAVREKGLWRLVRPIQARADASRVVNLVAKVLNTTIEEFVSDDGADLNAHGLADPRGSVTLTPEGGGEPQVLEFGPAPEGEAQRIKARFATRKSIYALSKESASILDTKPNDLRERKLSRFDRDLVDRVTLESKSHGRTVLSRKQEEWVINPDKEGKGRSANRGDVNLLLDRLTGTEVREFVADTASDLARYGLQDPTLKVTVSSFTSEPTAESAAGEHPIVTIGFGRTENGVVFARLENEPFVVSIDASILHELDRPAVAFREPTVLSGKADDIRAFTLRKGTGEIEIRGERNAEGIWKAPGGGELAAKPVAIQSMVNVLANLRAARWVAAAPDATHGFDQPALTVEFTHGSENRTLTIGNPTPAGHRFAKASTTDGVFEVNASDYSVLDLPLEAPAPAAGASPSTSPAAAEAPPAN